MKDKIIATIDLIAELISTLFVLAVVVYLTHLGTRFCSGFRTTRNRQTGLVSLFF